MTSTSPNKPNKRAKKNNTPVVCVRCENCDDQDIQFKLITKLTTCKEADLHKFHQFWNSFKLENRLMATLPPLAERDNQLNQNLKTVIQQHSESETHFLNEVLPKCVDDIQIAWYERNPTPRKIFSIPETDSDTLLCTCCNVIPNIIFMGFHYLGG